MSDYANTPTTALAEGETVQASFSADRATYIRDHAWLAAAAMAAGMGILWALGNPHVWTGAVGGLAAVVLRAWFVASDELAVRWDLTDRRLLGPGSRAVRLAEIGALNTLGSAVQVVTLTGDKHLLKYQKDRDATRTRIAAVQAGRRDG
ncbi:hypothetical protein SAMN05216196_101903 [Lutimaribacter pacificus]|uniref:PH domain-containing protein n=1 Tax=Lutimaribacter pacificus TaxID=391948 RepID=A0A1H0CDZ4_9RHOB|nr:hypothetical protein [Lutimaribacter pacificus]SDN56043.1 hypothetical protein SAMN05216196_101903 [Lutimaribacter pacificus]SHJ45645.1 hypothetical protein SAMN05444142_101314 [Lutimaribacter pacificus]